MTAKEMLTPMVNDPKLLERLLGHSCPYDVLGAPARGSVRPATGLQQIRFCELQHNCVICWGQVIEKKEGV